MKKIKLENRISFGYVILFLILMLFSNFSLIYILKSENKKQLEDKIIEKSNEINDFLNKVTVFSQRYNNFSLEFRPKIEGQKVTYSKPFNPGEENYHYVLVLNEDKSERKIFLNTLLSLDYEDKEFEASKLINKLIDLNIEENEPYKGEMIKFFNGIQNKGKEYYVFKLTREIKGNKFAIYILKDITIENVIINRVIIIGSIIMLIGILIIMITSKYISKKILKPVNLMIKTTNKITADDLSKRIPLTNSGDELEKLTMIMNEMLDRIETAFYNQSKFVSDASHELRTPLAIMKGYAEIIKRRKMANPEIFEESIDSIINEADNMENLVEKLLFLARNETKRLNSNFEIINIGNLISHIETDMAISVKSHNFILEKIEHFYILGDETLLQQSIRALIENSIKYSNKNTNIYIKTELKNDKGIISIRDEGYGMTEFDMKRIFERFYRVDEARTKNKNSGFGLGLSIVKKIVELHKGRIEVDSELNVGTEMRIVLDVEKIDEESFS